MSIPGRVQALLGEEEVSEQVPLGDDDALYLTPTRTLVHRAGTFLREESVEEYSNRVSRLTLNEGRRKARLGFAYTDREDRELSMSRRHVDSALPTILTGILAATNTIEDDESVVQSYRSGELTVVVTTQRLFKHVGAAIWDDEYEFFPYQDIIGLRIEEGTVATQIVIEQANATERLKVPHDVARSLREHLERTLCAFHGVDSVAELRAAAGTTDREPERSDPELASGLDPLTVDQTDRPSSPREEFEKTPFEPPARVEGSIEEQLAELQATIEEHSKVLERHTETLRRIERALTRDR